MPSILAKMIDRRVRLLPSESALPPTWQGMASRESVTGLLGAWSEGDRAALSSLMPLVYDDLRRLAEKHMRNEHADHSMRRTELVHEAYLRLEQQVGLDVRCRARFFGLVSTIMRHILVDQARARLAARRGAGAAHSSLDDTASGLQAHLAIDAALAMPDETVDLIALDESLQRLEQLDPQQARVVEMRFFVGMSVDETADALALSPTTVKREWATARAWLLVDIGRGTTSTAQPSPAARRVP